MVQLEPKCNQRSYALYFVDQNGVFRRGLALYNSILNRSHYLARDGAGMFFFYQHYFPVVLNAFGTV